MLLHEMIKKDINTFKWLTNVKIRVVNDNDKPIGIVVEWFIGGSDSITDSYDIDELRYVIKSFTRRDISKWPPGSEMKLCMRYAYNRFRNKQLDNMHTWAIIQNAEKEYGGL